MEDCSKSAHSRDRMRSRAGGTHALSPPASQNSCEWIMQEHHNMGSSWKNTASVSLMQYYGPRPTYMADVHNVSDKGHYQSFSHILRAESPPKVWLHGKSDVWCNKCLQANKSMAHGSHISCFWSPLLSSDDFLILDFYMSGKHKAGRK